MPYAPSFVYLCVIMSAIGIADGVYFSASLVICQEIFDSSRLVNQAMVSSCLFSKPIHPKTALSFSFSSDIFYFKYIFKNIFYFKYNKGYFYTFMAIPMSIGPTVAAFIFEHCGNYRIGFLHGGMICILGFVIQIFYPEGILIQYLKLKKSTRL